MSIETAERNSKRPPPKNAFYSRLNMKAIKTMGMYEKLGIE